MNGFELLQWLKAIGEEDLKKCTIKLETGNGDPSGIYPLTVPKFYKSCSFAEKNHTIYFIYK